MFVPHDGVEFLPIESEMKPPSTLFPCLPLAAVLNEKALGEGGTEFSKEPLAMQ